MHVTSWSINCALLVISLSFVYWYWLRPYLKTLPSFADAWAEEDRCWDAVCGWTRGRREILIGVWGEIIAVGPDALQIVSGVDLKQLLGLPDLWAAWVTAVIPILMLIFRAKAKRET